MCYWRPFIYESVEKILAERYGRIYLFPVYPQYSFTTTGVCYNKLNQALAGRPFTCPSLAIYRFNTHRPYLEALASRIREAAGTLGRSMKDIHLLFSAHSLPQYAADRGDPYVED
jgi:ferrochelatase